jgi:hypothetical protein
MNGESSRLLDDRPEGIGVGNQTIAPAREIAHDHVVPRVVLRVSSTASAVR